MANPSQAMEQQAFALKALPILLLWGVTIEGGSRERGLDLGTVRVNTEVLNLFTSAAHGLIHSFKMPY